MRKCCPNCFNDPHLRANIPLMSSTTGTCSFCQKSETPLIDPLQLRELFEFVSGIYIQAETEESKTLGEWLTDDWSMFKLSEQPHIKDLLSEIFGDGNIPRAHYIPSSNAYTGTLNKWGLLPKKRLRMAGLIR